MFFRNAVAVMLLLAAAPSMANLYRVTYNALVVGNARYPNMEIRNGVNDAKLIAQGFKQNGFEVVTVYEADRVALLESLSQFVAEPKDGSSRELTVVYLSGAGFHCNGEDFFIPHMSIQKNMRKKISLNRQMMERAVPLRQIRERLDGLGGN